MAELEAAGWPPAPWELEAAPATWVLGRGGLHGPGDRLTAWRPASLEELAGAAIEAGVGAVWIHESALSELGWPESIPHHRGPPEGHPHAFFESVGPFTTRLRSPGLAAYAKWFIAGGAGVELHVPAYTRRRRRDGTLGAGGPFAALESPWELAWSLAAYHVATRGRWPWRGNGGITSDAWIRTRHRGRLKITEEAPPYLEGLAGEADFSWIRDPAGGELSARYLLAFDLNAAYLGAASSLSLPAGALEHGEGAGVPAVVESLPGYWRFEAPAIYRGPGPAPASAEWVTTPTAAYLVKAFGLEPLESYTWPEHHAYLRPWYAELREARAIASRVPGPALSAIKSIYKAGLGRLESTRRSSGAELHQPYWGQAVTAAARCNIHRRILALEGVEPVGVNVDCLYFLTNSTSHGAFAARAGLPLGDGLGEYSPKGARAAGKAAREILSAGGAYSPRLERNVGPLGALDELVAGAA